MSSAGPQGQLSFAYLRMAGYIEKYGIEICKTVCAGFIEFIAKGPIFLSRIFP